MSGGTIIVANEVYILLARSESGSKKNLSSRFPTRSDTNRAIHPQKTARGLKFRTQGVYKLYYLCSENKGAGQLRSYRAGDLCLLFSPMQKQVFS